MRHVRLLFWLKWKLLLRGYRRSKSEVLGALLLLLIMTPFGLGVAVWFGAHFLYADASEVENWLRTALLSIYAFWIFVPILGYSLNDSYDITRLFVYPLSMRQIFTGTIAGTLLDRPTILLLPTFAAIIVGFVRDPIAAVIVVVVLALFLFHTLALSQAILMAGAGLFQSRKFRDTAVIIFPLIWVIYYMRFVVARQARTEQWDAFVHSPAWGVVNLLPQGWAAHAIYAAHTGSYGAALLWTAGLAGFTYGTVALAGWTLQKVYSGETISAPSRSSDGGSEPRTRAPEPRQAAAGAEAPSDAVVLDQKRSGPASGVRSILPAWLPNMVRAVADKEFRYLARDPYYKMVLVNLLWPLVLPIVLSSRAGGMPSGPAGTPSSWSAWIGPTMMTFLQMQLTYNIFGTEGGAAALLFLFPAARRSIVVGKNVFHFTLLSSLNLLMTAIILALTRNVGISGLLLFWMELALLLNLSLGNIFSLYFPMRVVMRGWRVQYRTSGIGCLFFVLYMVAWMVSLLLFVPVAAALALPLLHGFGASEAWLALTMPAAATYVALVYLFSLYLTDLLLPRREFAIVAKVTQEQT